MEGSDRGGKDNRAGRISENGGAAEKWLLKAKFLN